jgi:hypothetical protein
VNRIEATHDLYEYFSAIQATPQLKFGSDQERSVLLPRGLKANEERKEKQPRTDDGMKSDSGRDGPQLDWGPLRPHEHTGPHDYVVRLIKVAVYCMCRGVTGGTRRPARPPRHLEGNIPLCRSGGESSDGRGGHAVMDLTAWNAWGRRSAAGARKGPMLPAVPVGAPSLASKGGWAGSFPPPHSCYPHMQPVYRRSAPPRESRRRRGVPRRGNSSDRS